MGFDFGAFVGGFGKQIAYDLDQARQQRYKMELIGEEAATQERLRKSREREERKQQLQDAVDELAGMIGREGATWASKNYSYGEINGVVKRLRDYDGDTFTAFNMPKIPDNNKFGTEIAKPQELPPLLSTFNLKKQEENLATTSERWIIAHNKKVMEIKRDPNLDQKQKDEQLNLLEEDKKNYFNIHKQFAEAKREEDEEKPVDRYAQQKLDTFYDDAAQRNIFKSFQNTAFQNMTGIPGKVEDFMADFRGTNTAAFANYRAAMSALEFNINGYNDKYFTQFLESQAILAEDSLSNFAGVISESVKNKVNELKNSDVPEATLEFSETAKRPEAIMNIVDFEAYAQREQLKPQGVYLVKYKSPDGSFAITPVTYLGAANPFDPSGENYIFHKEYQRKPATQFEFDLYKEGFYGK